jgi:hypothetical protein
MGNPIKNYEKKQRKARREAYREVRDMVHDTIIEQMGLSRGFKQKEREIYDCYKSIDK